VHVRLIAPLEKRIAHIVSIRSLSERDAAAEVRRLDREREAFHQRFSPDKALLPEIFTITLNTALAAQEQLVECVLPIVRGAFAVPPPHVRVGTPSERTGEPVVV
jgi:hypothetical protein